MYTTLDGRDLGVYEIGQYLQDTGAVAPIGETASKASTAESQPAAAAAVPAVAASAISGGAKITTGTDLSVQPMAEWTTPDMASLENQQKQFAEADKLFGSSAEMIAGLREKNQSWMKGEISGDTQDQLRSASALSSRAGGAAGSPAARNLQARDFGLTSMQIQESGMQREAQLSELNKGLGAIREQRAQFLTSLHEQSKQFGANISDQMMRTQLAHKELMLKQDAFNAEQNLRLVELISQSNLGMFQVQASLASAGVSDSGVTASFNQLQAQMEALLARSNP